jgi:hypothetical protein
MEDDLQTVMFDMSLAHTWRALEHLHPGFLAEFVDGLEREAFFKAVRRLRHPKEDTMVTAARERLLDLAQHVQVVTVLEREKAGRRRKRP